MNNKSDGRKHSHYFKDVSHLEYVDIYRFLSLFNVTDPCLQHAVKKIMVSGGRGVKDIDKDIQESIDTLVRWQEMRIEDAKYSELGGKCSELPGECSEVQKAQKELQKEPFVKFNGGHVDGDVIRLKRGLCHTTKEAAIAHARAIILAGGGEV